MNPLLASLRSALVNIIRSIDNGDCDDLTNENIVQIASVANEFIRTDRPMSKYQAYTYLNISRATFDNYVALGIIPRGKRQQGFKELSWTKKELDKAKDRLKK